MERRKGRGGYKMKDCHSTVGGGPHRPQQEGGAGDRKWRTLCAGSIQYESM